MIPPGVLLAGAEYTTCEMRTTRRTKVSLAALDPIDAFWNMMPTGAENVHRDSVKVVSASVTAKFMFKANDMSSYTAACAAK